MEERLYKAPLASPTNQSNYIMDVLPGYMLNKDAVDHVSNMKKLKAEDETSKTTKFTLNKLEPVLESSQKDQQQAGQQTAYDGLSASIKYSLGLASIMNKYNISTTSDIVDYKNNDIFIKTKKQQQQQHGQTNTLIFVNKKERERGGLQETDMLSELIRLNIKPTNYIMSKNIRLTNNETVTKVEEDEDPNDRLKHVVFKNSQVERKKRLFELMTDFEDLNYTQNILQPSLFEREEEDNKLVKKIESKDEKAGRS